MEKFLSVREAGAMLGLNRRTIYARLETGELRGIRLGKQWRIRQGYLEDKWRAAEAQKESAREAPQAD